jgi:hypothetical protein
VRTRLLSSVLVALGFGLVVALPARAQAPADPQAFSVAAIDGRASHSQALTGVNPVVDVSFMAPQAAAVRQNASTAGAWRPLVFAGFVSHAGSAFTVGGGAIKNSFLNNEKYGLQLDVAYNRFGDFTNGCDLVGISCSANQLTFSGAFLYMFTPTTSGWTPYAGGGIVFIRTSFGTDVSNLVASASVTDAGIQVQGGIMKDTASGKKVGGELRIQGAGGGGFVLLGRLVF